MGIWEKTLFKDQSKYNGEVKVIENSGSRLLIANGYIQSQSVRADGHVGNPLWENLIPQDISLNPDSRVLILGLGAGTVASIITNRFGAITIDGVDIDPLIIKLGQKYFSMNQKNLNIFVLDAVDFVTEARYKYDLICVDIFRGKGVPKGIESKVFLENIKNLLKDNGVLTINKIYSGFEELNRFKKFVQEVFPTSNSIVIKGTVNLDNVIVYAYK